MNLLRIALLVLAGLLSMGSALLERHTQVKSAATVQPPTAPSWSGRKQEKRLELAGSYSKVTAIEVPDNAATDSHGLGVAQTAFSGSAFVRAGRRDQLAVGLFGSFSQVRDAVALDPSFHALPRDGRSFTFGGSGRLAFPLTDSRWSIGLSGALGVVSARQSSTETCTSGCGYGGFAPRTSDSTLSGVLLQGSFRASYREGSITLFGGVTMRNHTVNGEADYGTVDSEAYGKSSSFGPMIAMVGGGIQWHPVPDFAVAAHVFQPASLSEIQYGPVAGLTLSLGLFDGKPKTQESNQR